MPIISKFDGGIITGVNDMYLKDEHATVLTNVDIERIGLLSYKDKLRIGTAEPYFYEFPVTEEVTEGGEQVLKLLDPPEYHVTSATNHRSYAEFEGKLCYSDGGPQCRFTEGEMNAAGTDFKWLDMGVDAPDGEIVARPITVDEDIGPDMYKLISDGRGYINIPHIKYRIVDDQDVVYIANIDDNPGNSIVEWKLPSGYKVYREIIDEYREHTNQFSLVGEGTFTDGGSESYDKYNFITIDNIMNYASYRLCYVDDVIYSIPFAVIKQARKATIVVDAIYALDENEGTWQKESLSISVKGTASNGIASGFVWRGKLYIMIELGKKLYIYDRKGKRVYSGSNIGSEFFKCTTIEKNDKLYQFDPSAGKVAILSEVDGGPAYTEEVDLKIGWEEDGIWEREYVQGYSIWYKGKLVKHDKWNGHTAPMSYTTSDGTVLHRDKTVQKTRSENPCQPNCPRALGYRTWVEEARVAPGKHLEMNIKTMTKFPYAQAQDSVYTIHGDTVYALINDRASANVRQFNLTDFKVKSTGFAKLEVKKVVGLGGTSGCDFVQGDYQVFPVMGGALTYSRLTDQLSRWDNPKAVSTRKPKGFVFANSHIVLVAGGQLIQWKFSDKSVDYDLFDVRTLTGSYVYNVGQQTQSGVDGPVMLIETDPVSITKGHMHVDLSKVIHTNELRLYRTGGHLTVFKMVKDVDPGTTFEDKVDDVTLALAREGEYKQAYAPKAGMRFLTAHRGIMFGAVGNYLYWSKPGAHEQWDEVSNMKLMDRQIYGLVSCVNGLLIFMENRIALLAGSTPLEFDMRTVTDEVGSIDELGIRSVGTGAMFFSKKGLCMTDGIVVKDISYDLLGSIEFTTLACTSTDRNYYAVVNNWTESPEPFIVLIYDITRDPTFTMIDASLVEGLGIVDGKIAHTNKGELYDTFGGIDEREYHYKSGNINMQQPTVVKEWDRVRLTGEFVGKLIVYIDDKVSIIEDIDSLNERVNLHLPKRDNKGKNIKFELIGKGDVVSIEYSITERKTTK